MSHRRRIYRACRAVEAATECAHGHARRLRHHDSPLGRWTRALYFPDPPLADHVEMFWHVSGRANYARDRRLPTGRTHLLFNLGAPPTLFRARARGGAAHVSNLLDCRPERKLYRDRIAWRDRAAWRAVPQSRRLSPAAHRSTRIERPRDRTRSRCSAIASSACASVCSMRRRRKPVSPCSSTG